MIVEVIVGLSAAAAALLAGVLIERQKARNEADARQADRADRDAALADQVPQWRALMVLVLEEVWRLRKVITDNGQDPGPMSPALLQTIAELHLAFNPVDGSFTVPDNGQMPS